MNLPPPQDFFCPRHGFRSDPCPVEIDRLRCDCYEETERETVADLTHSLINQTTAARMWRAIAEQRKETIAQLRDEIVASGEQCHVQ